MQTSKPNQQVIRENLTKAEALEIRTQERALGNNVDINRISPSLVEIIITSLVVYHLPARQPQPQLQRAV